MEESPSQNRSAVRHSQTHPKFLHSNSTSHTWAFGAIAELIDNSADPDANATSLSIEVENKDEFQEKLIVKDNGNGMNPEQLLRMMSFGYCDKKDETREDGKIHQAIGHYGNGFKSGSMRIAKDVLVFTHPKSNKDQISVGMLSQTYLKAVGATEVLVPIVTWQKIPGRSWTLLDLASDGENLDCILKHSPWGTEEDLFAYGKAHLDNHHPSRGTTIVLYNLNRDPETNKLELSFSPGEGDIRLLLQDPTGQNQIRYCRQRVFQDSEQGVGIDFSLRQYLEVLYLKPRMRINLLGIKVITRLIEKNLGHTSVREYKPHSSRISVKIVLGFHVGKKNEYGMMLYHKGRLIKPFVRVGIQNAANKMGVGVIGVVEANYLQPTHNKQDFNHDQAYRNLEATLGQHLKNYWQEQTGRRGNIQGRTEEGQPNGVSLQEETTLCITHDQPWVQCDNPDCLKWRKLAPGTDQTKLPASWTCDLNPDPTFNNCMVPEEPDDLAVISAALPPSSNDPAVVQADPLTQAERLASEQQRLENSMNKAAAEHSRVNQRHAEQLARIQMQTHVVEATLVQAVNAPSQQHMGQLPVAQPFQFHNQASSMQFDASAVAARAAADALEKQRAANALQAIQEQRDRLARLAAEEAEIRRESEKVLNRREADPVTLQPAKREREGADDVAEEAPVSKLARTDEDVVALLEGERAKLLEAKEQISNLCGQMCEIVDRLAGREYLMATPVGALLQAQGEGDCDYAAIAAHFERDETTVDFVEHVEKNGMPTDAQNGSQAAVVAPPEPQRKARRNLSSLKEPTLMDNNLSDNDDLD